MAEQDAKAANSAGYRAAHLETFQFQPGQSGNPSGRPKKKPLTELYEQLLADPKVMADLRKVLAKSLKSGEVQLLREMADRVEGKVTQSIEHSGHVSLESLIVAANKDEPSNT